MYIQFFFFFLQDKKMCEDFLKGQVVSVCLGKERGKVGGGRSETNKENMRSRGTGDSFA